MDKGRTYYCLRGYVWNRNSVAESGEREDHCCELEWPYHSTGNLVAAVSEFKQRNCEAKELWTSIWRYTDLLSLLFPG